jgi:hypothetical protein
MTFLDMSLWGITWLSMSLGNVSLASMSLRNMSLSNMAWLLARVLGRVFLDVVFLAALTDFVEGCSDSMEKTASNVSVCVMNTVETVTYVLKMAKMNVPQGKLQLSSVVSELFPKTPCTPRVS